MEPAFSSCRLDAVEFGEGVRTDPTDRERDRLELGSLMRLRVWHAVCGGEEPQRVD